VLLAAFSSPTASFDGLTEGSRALDACTISNRNADTRSGGVDGRLLACWLLDSGGRARPSFAIVLGVIVAALCRRWSESLDHAHEDADAAALVLVVGFVLVWPLLIDLRRTAATRISVVLVVVRLGRAVFSGGLGPSDFRALFVGLVMVRWPSRAIQLDRHDCLVARWRCGGRPLEWLHLFPGFVVVAFVGWGLQPRTDQLWASGCDSRIRTMPGCTPT